MPPGSHAPRSGPRRIPRAIPHGLAHPRRLPRTHLDPQTVATQDLALPRPVLPPFPFCTSAVGPDGRRGARVRGIGRAATDGEEGCGASGHGATRGRRGVGSPRRQQPRLPDGGGRSPGVCCPGAAAARRSGATACRVPGMPGRTDDEQRGGDARDGRPGGAGRTSLYRASKVSATGHPTPMPLYASPRSSWTPPAAA
ncbi:hypothetical protein BS78_09G169200 [Paspalum vaginatum]|nr:hypothetical protein BS78_09G169200 [Paspalum vaginatum]